MGCVLGVLTGWSAMPVSIAVLLGVVEGLTEYLPVSSTGHLELAGHILGLPDDAASSSFEIVIQLGAILAVVVHYRVLLADRIRGLFTRDAVSIRLVVALAIAFAPAAVVGLALRKTIKEHLFNPVPIAAALIIGGVVMIVLERALSRRARTPMRRARERDAPARLSHRSRPMRLPVAGLVALDVHDRRGAADGLSTATAAEFSFLLALPTLGAATLYEASRRGRFSWPTAAAWPCRGARRLLSSWRGPSSRAS